MENLFAENLINNLLSTGADYSEVYYENSIIKTYELINGKLDNIECDTKEGIGLRILKDDKYYYSSTNKLDEENLIRLSNELKNEINFKNQYKYVNLNKKRVNNPKIKIKHADIETKDKVNILKKIDLFARNYSTLINQVYAFIREIDIHKKIANSDGVITDSYETRTRLYIKIYASKNEKIFSNYEKIDYLKGYEMFDDIILDKFVKKVCDELLESLNAVKFKGGTYPAIIGNGFGAVIFHEACGHALEASSVSIKKSVLTGKINKKIASAKVTLIDDGTLNDMWGSTIIDDEGEYAKKNILIENGILKNYLVDRYHEKIMNQKKNGCARRESYLYAPTSRMSNTYLSSGNDKIEDMFKSIKYGVYIKDIDYGCVQPSTGDFNFYTKNTYLIENGKITDKIYNVSLIGNCIDILKNVEMVSDNLKLGGGYCGAESGTVFVTVGQPLIKISNILIGGDNSE